ncbi:MAG: hypothetical protein AVDCRST_MAG16-1185, partial [uncultured Frankineae bacterium]
APIRCPRRDRRRCGVRPAPAAVRSGGQGRLDRGDRTARSAV